jgi:CheY-like chemotaxis protein
MKILVVDDDRDTNDLMKAVGKHAGVDVIAFESGLDALKFLEDHEVDVAVLDLEMPILDGLRLAKEIRKNEELHPGKAAGEVGFCDRPSDRRHDRAGWRQSRRPKTLHDAQTIRRKRSDERIEKRFW